MTERQIKDESLRLAEQPADFFGPTGQRVRVKPYEPAHLMSSPWCRYYEGQIGTIVRHGWVICKVAFDDGQTHSLTYYSLDEP